MKQFKRLFICLTIVFVLGIGYATPAEALFSNIIANYASNGFCWFCPIFAGFFSAVNELATNIAYGMSNMFMMLLALGLLFYILMLALKNFMQVQPMNAAQFFGSLFKIVGKTMIATALLYSMMGVFIYIVSPTITMSMGLSMAVLESGGLQDKVAKISQGIPSSAQKISDQADKKTAEENSKVAPVVSVPTTSKKGTTTTASQKEGVETKPLCSTYSCDKYFTDKNNLTAMDADGNINEGQTTALTRDVCRIMECTIRQMSVAMMFGIAFATSMYEAGWTNRAWGIFPDLWLIIASGIMMVCYFILLLIYPFKLFDAMMKFGFVCVLAPLFVVCWVFPATAGYAKKGWEMLLNVCLTFFFLSIVLVLILNLMSYPMSGVMDSIVKLLNAGKDAEAAKLIPLGGVDLFILLAMTFLSTKILGTANTMADTFAGAPSFGMGDAGFAVAAGAAGAAGSVAKMSAPVVKKGAEKVGGAFGSVARGGIAVAGGFVNTAKRRTFELFGGNKDGVALRKAVAGALKNKMPVTSFQNTKGQKVKATIHNGKISKLETALGNGKRQIDRFKDGKLVSSEVMDERLKNAAELDKKLNMNDVAVKNMEKRLTGGTLDKTNKDGSASGHTADGRAFDRIFDDGDNIWVDSDKDNNIIGGQEYARNKDGTENKNMMERYEVRDGQKVITGRTIKNEDGSVTYQNIGADGKVTDAVTELRKNGHLIKSINEEYGADGQVSRADSYETSTDKNGNSTVVHESRVGDKTERTSETRTAKGNLVESSSSSTDASGTRSARHTFDASGAGVTFSEGFDDGKGNTSFREINQNADVISAYETQNGKTTYSEENTYDAAGQLASSRTVDAEGATTVSEFDGAVMTHSRTEDQSGKVIHSLRAEQRKNGTIDIYEKGADGKRVYTQADEYGSCTVKEGAHGFENVSNTDSFGRESGALFANAATVGRRAGFTAMKDGIHNASIFGWKFGKKIVKNSAWDE